MLSAFINSMTCSTCGEPFSRIERYHVTVEWSLDRETGDWSLGAYDNGTHFHVFCANEHETKVWGQGLPPELQAICFPGETDKQSE